VRIPCANHSKTYREFLKNEVPRRISGANIIQAAKKCSFTLLDEIQKYNTHTGYYRYAASGRGSTIMATRIQYAHILVHK
jgi:homoserine kinase